MNSLASLVDRTLVSHAPFQAAVREIETCFEFALEASEPICVALIGPSRTGKSRVLDVCERQHPKVRREDGMYVPILRVYDAMEPVSACTDQTARGTLHQHERGEARPNVQSAPNRTARHFLPVAGRSLEVLSFAWASAHPLGVGCNRAQTVSGMRRGEGAY